MKPNLTTQFRTNVLCAGSSALMLAFAHVHADLWFLALFALVPFLWRTASVGRQEAAALGAIMAVGFLLATSAGQLVTSTMSFLLQLGALGTAFGLFGYAINRLSARLGFNPLLIAVVWFPLGLLLAQILGLGEAILFGQTGPELLLGLGSMVGLLLWSSLLVMINGLILLLARFIKHQLIRRKSRRSTPGGRIAIRAVVFLRPSYWGKIPSYRAPPILCLTP